MSSLVVGIKPFDPASPLGYFFVFVRFRMQNMYWGVIWIVMSAFIWYAADQRGRSGFFWFVISLIVTPIIPAIILMLLPVKEGKQDLADRKACPQCAESVKQEAKVCKHCGYRISVY